jgi:molybdopterin synthase sulfur carrier subunit
VSLNVLYFAWVRERIGVPSEKIETNAKTVLELIADLKTRDPRYEAAFADTSVLRAAIDQILCDTLDAEIKEAREVAFFPPMTGG